MVYLFWATWIVSWSAIRLQSSPACYLSIPGPWDFAWLTVGLTESEHKSAQGIVTLGASPQGLLVLAKPHRRSALPNVLAGAQDLLADPGRSRPDDDPQPSFALYLNRRISGLSARSKRIIASIICVGPQFSQGNTFQATDVHANLLPPIWQTILRFFYLFFLLFGFCKTGRPLYRLDPFQQFPGLRNLAMH